MACPTRKRALLQKRLCNLEGSWAPKKIRSLLQKSPTRYGVPYQEKGSFAKEILQLRKFVGSQTDQVSFAKEPLKIWRVKAKIGLFFKRDFAI